MTYAKRYAIILELKNFKIFTETPGGIMTKIIESNYIFCPYCSSRLTTLKIDGVQKKVCTYCNWTHHPSVGQASVGLIFRKNKVLLVKRNREPHKNTWGFPAGFVEYGESPIDALKREIRQEVGLIVKKATFIKFIQSNEDPRSPGHFLFFYWVTTQGKIKNNDPKENQEIAWFNIKNPPEIGWPSHKKLFQILQTKTGITKIKRGKI